jgi:hypothetical protein
MSDAGCQLCPVKDSASTLEPAAHEALKVLAVRWAYWRGFRSIGFEVCAPSSKFRVDVAAYRSYRRSEKREPTVAVFECKQSRSDLLRDLGQRAKLLERLEDLHYLVACRSIVRQTEVPIGWGLLETADLQTIDETLPAKFFASANSPWWLDRIARSATSRVMRQLGSVSSLNAGGAQRA